MAKEHPRRSPRPPESAGKKKDEDLQKWEAKYKFFSGTHMQACHPVSSRARRDPFNKDPGWCSAIIKNLAEAIESKGMRPRALFHDADARGNSNGCLERPELKRSLARIAPNMSDEEVTCIFDTIDRQGKGTIEAEKFCEALASPGADAQGRDKKGRRQRPPAKGAWRNPVHRMKRFPPACVEGWDHLEGEVLTKREDQLIEREQTALLSRLSDVLARPSAVKSQSQVPKHHYLNGGHDSDRFERLAWERRTGELDPMIPDPGRETRAGWLCEPKDMRFSNGFNLTPKHFKAARNPNLIPAQRRCERDSNQ